MLCIIPSVTNEITATMNAPKSSLPQFTLAMDPPPYGEGSIVA